MAESHCSVTDQKHKRVAILALWFVEPTHQYLLGRVSLISMLPLPPELFIK